MSNRLWLAVVALVAACALGAPASASALHTVTNPNIVLILSDDQAPFDTVRSSAMPFLTAQDPANGGTWFRWDAAYINLATCCPSRATILSGQWSHHTGVEVTSGAPQFDDAETIATALDGDGYRTGWFGKYHLGKIGGLPSELYVPPGWDQFVDHRADALSACSGANGPYYDYSLNDNGTAVCKGSADADYSVDVLRDMALDFIDPDAARGTGEPFFLVLATRAPHDNWTAATRHLNANLTEPVPKRPNFNEQDISDKSLWWRGLERRNVANQNGSKRKHWDTLLGLDDAVEAIRDELNTHGYLDDTLILYMTDNGFAFGEHRHNHKICPFEECSRTPLYARVGGHATGTTFSQIVGNEDLCATFADLAATSCPTPNGRSTDGQSFADVLRGSAWPGGVWNDEALLRGFNPGAQPGDVPTFWGIRSGVYKYIEYPGTAEAELYDLWLDPFELSNRIDDPVYDAIQAALDARLAVLDD